MREAIAAGGVLGVKGKNGIRIIMEEYGKLYATFFIFAAK